MIDPVQVLWSPAGATIPSPGDLALVDVHDGDTPSVRMSVRMLSIDTPEITAISADGALNVDRKFADLAQWITEGAHHRGARRAGAAEAGEGRKTLTRAQRARSPSTWSWRAGRPRS